MPLMRQDVEMLNRSLSGLGDSFRQTRLDAEAKKQRDLDNSLRERMLTRQERHADEQSEGAVEAYLQGQDGVVVGFRGSPKALQAYSSNAGLKPVQKPQTGQHPYRVSFTTEDADVTVYAKDTTELDKILSEAKKSGAKPRQPGTMETGETRNFAKMQELQDAVTNASTPEEASKAEAALQAFQELIQTSRETKPDAGAMTALNKLQQAWAEAIQNNNPEEADRIARHIESTRQKWNINPGTTSPAQGELPPLATASTPAQSVETELKLAQDAIRQGANRAKVAAKFKARTGQDLPQ